LQRLLRLTARTTVTEGLAALLDGYGDDTRLRSA